MSQHRQTLGAPGTPFLNTDQLRIERRGWARNECTEVVTAVFSDDDRMGVTRMEVVDKSLTGLGATCRNELVPGMRVKLTAPGVNVPTRTGTVVRCGAASDHYSVGIRLDRALAAA
ncbi:MAG: hypothetical protein ACREJO_15110 [Phycisphaerales bacterium]